MPIKIAKWKAFYLGDGVNFAGQVRVSPIAASEYPIDVRERGLYIIAQGNFRYRHRAAAASETGTCICRLLRDGCAVRPRRSRSE